MKTRIASATASATPRTMLGLALLMLGLAACEWSTSGQAPPLAGPLVRSTSPLDSARSVPLNSKVSVVFDMPMRPLTAENFTLRRGETLVPGTVTTSADGVTATFVPSEPLAAESDYTAIIGAGTLSLGGSKFVANSSWRFSTGRLADLTLPVVSATSPAADAVDVQINVQIAATFSKAMDPGSLTANTFLVKNGDAQVPGDVAYGSGQVVTFTPAMSLPRMTRFTATLTSAVKDIQGNSLASAFTWSFTTGTKAAPTLLSVSPSDGDTDVAANVTVSAIFDMAMQSLTSSTFMLKQASTPILGGVVTSADGTVATFTPSSSLAPGTVFTATIVAGATSLTNSVFATDRSWSFTTEMMPSVTATSPVAGAIGVPVNIQVGATFNKALDPLTVTSDTFTLKQGLSPVAGRVAYGPGSRATFTPTNPLAVDSLFTATLTTAVKDVKGNPLANAFTWIFTTGNGTARGPAPVLLGLAGNFVVLAKAAISSVPASNITGDIGVSPAAATYMTGFSLIADPSNAFSRSSQITGRAYAANYAVPTPANLTTAVHNMESAHVDAAGRPTPDFTELYSGNIGGRTLAPGLYKWTSAVVIPTIVTLSGGANDVWIFQTTGDLVMSANQRVNLSGGAMAKNVFWQVAGHAIIGAGAHFEGILICKTNVTLQSGATMSGRILAQTQVALQQATVTTPPQ